MYLLAFLRRDTREMQRLLTEALSTEDEPTLLRMQSDTEAHYGRLSQARSFSRRAVESALRVSPDAKAMEQAISALREAEFGSPTLVRQTVKSATDRFSELRSFRTRRLAR